MGEDGGGWGEGLFIREDSGRLPWRGVGEKAAEGGFVHACRQGLERVDRAPGRDLTAGLAAIVKRVQK